MTQIDTRTDLYLDQLRDLFSAESQIALTIDWLAERASSELLRGLLREHGRQTDRQKERIREVFARYGSPPMGNTCQSVRGLIDGGNKQIEWTENPKVGDLLIVDHFTRVKHYEVAGYQFVVTLERRLCLDGDVARFTRSLEEECGVIRKLEEQSTGLSLPPKGAPAPEVGRDARQIPS